MTSADPSDVPTWLARPLALTRTILLLGLVVLAARLVLDGWTLLNLALDPSGLLDWIENTHGIPTRAARVLHAWAIVGMEGVLPFLTGVALLVAGWALALKTPRGLAGLSLGLFLLAGWLGFLFNPLLFDLPWWAEVWGVSPLPRHLTRLFSVWVWATNVPWWWMFMTMLPLLGATVAATAFLQFTLHFPSSLEVPPPVSRRRRARLFHFLRMVLPSSRMLWPVAAGIIVLLAGGVLVRGFTRYTWTSAFLFSAPRGLSYVLVLAFFLAGVANLRYTVRTASGENRRRALWIAGGVVVFLLGSAFFVATRFFWFQYARDYAIIPSDWSPFRQYLAVADTDSLVAALAWIGTSGAFLYAIFGAGALDPGLAIKRSTVYGSLGVLFLALFAGLESMVEDFVRAQLGLPGQVGTMVAAGTIALVLIPLHKRVKRIADRLIPLEGDPPRP